MSPEQCRAARGWLDWSQRDLAAKAGVSGSTLRDFETGRRIPMPNNLRALRRALEDAGIEFLFTGDVPLGITARGLDNAAKPVGRPPQSKKKRSAKTPPKRG